MVETLNTLAEALELELRERAQKSGWSLTENQQLRERSRDGVETILDALPRDTTDVPRPELRMPAFRRALELQPASIAVLLSGLEPTVPEESYRAALWWAGLVRSAISPVRRSDLHLILIAPAGTSDEPSWQARRGLYEADERFCRKFVWLPSQAPQRDEIGSFLDRTFLARPWEAQSAEPSSLDPLQSLVEEVGSDRNLTVAEAQSWIRRLSVPLDPGELPRLAEELVAMLEDPR
jgi:hypothetical protein